MTKERVQQLRTQGWVGGLPVFDQAEMDALNADLSGVLGLLRPGETTKEIREWHEASQFLFDGSFWRFVRDRLGGGRPETTP